MPASTWLAFRSACTEMDCIATGIRLDNQNHEKAATPEVRGVLRLVNGVWQDMTPTQVQAQATYTDDGSAACTAWQSVRFNLEPRPDGTFRGDRIQSTDTNECGNQGDTIVTPITATRVGGVPPGVLDNAERSSAPASSSPAPSSIVTVTATPQPAPQAAPAPWQAAPDPDLLFLNLVSQIPVTITDSAVLTASGRSICGDLQHGMTPAQVAAANVGNNGMTFAQTSAIVNAAITAFCPNTLAEHEKSPAVSEPQNALRLDETAGLVFRGLSTSVMVGGLALTPRGGDCFLGGTGCRWDRRSRRSLQPRHR
ncbi:hypothetical protein I552_9738 [Mycobacterium xenopi 3993]|nr:hypothetical protein I552_9738 [Mycobacterium xenopi 3993]